MSDQKNMVPATSPSLLMRLRDSGDDESWQLFNSLYGPIIRSYCHRRGLQPVDVDDVTQNVLARISQAIKSFEYEPARGKFRSWLGTVTSNAVNRHIAGAKNGQPLELLIEPLDYHLEDAIWSEIHARQVLSTACERIQPLFDRLTWLCFWKSWMEQLSVNEIASELDVAVHSVYVNKSRVLKRLQQEVIELTGEI